MVGAVVGIDLGTTNSAIAHVNRYGRPELIPIFEGGELLPSVVQLDDPPLVGMHAKNGAVGRPYDTVQFVKRHMGEPGWRFRSSSGREYSSEDISALILKRLVDDAEVHLDTTVDTAVISVPAYFDDSRRQATRDAGRIAGINVERIINEPTAAALAYGVDADSNATVLVYDLGGGTFDVTVMRSNGDELVVLSSNGDRSLGGFDWDNRLMEWLDEEFSRRSGVSHLDSAESEQDLRAKAELVKHSLSRRDRASVSLSVESVSHTIEVHRDKFEELTADLLKRTERILGYVLDEAGLTVGGVDKVLLVGGSTRMPAVPRLIERMTGRRPTPDVHPDKAVALGAAVLASVSSPEPVGVPVRDAAGGLFRASISDITSHSLGVAIVKDGPAGTKLVNEIVLPKGSSVPGRHRTVLFTTVHGQGFWEAQITEGEDEDLDYVSIVGTGAISIPAYPQGSPFEVVFEYDQDAIIHLYLRDLSANRLVGELHIERRANLTADDLERRRVAMSNVHPR